MRWREQRWAAAAIAVAACARPALPPVVTAPSEEAAAPSSSVSTATADSPPSDTQDREPSGDEPAARSTTTPPHRPQSDPVPPPEPRCPNVAPLVKASAVVKREPPAGARPPSQNVLDIELTVTLPASPSQVTLVPNAVTVYGGVLIERTRKFVDPTKAVLLIRPAWTVAREGSLMAMFGLTCPGAKGSLRVNMTFALPPKDGDKVAIRSVNGD
jgi:hypothetical protein